MVVVLASVVVSLVAAGSAQAAMAGANPLVTTNRPDLKTVTLMAGTNNKAQFCFAQTVVQIPSQSAFALGGYDGKSDPTDGTDQYLVSTNPTVVDPANNKCVDASFPVSIGDSGDLPQYTFGQVGEGAVLTQVGSGFVGNRSDSTALSGSNTHTGTAGHTAYPDLTGVVVDNVGTGNTLDFIYDKQLQISSVDPSKFLAYYQDGTDITTIGTGVTGVVVGGNVVKVTFSAPLNDPVHGPVVIGVSNADAVADQTADHEAGTVDTAAVAGTAGATTTLPDLIATQLSTDGTYVDYTFDKPLGALPTNAASNFEIALSNGQDIGMNNPPPSPATDPADEHVCAVTQTSFDGQATISEDGPPAPSTLCTAPLPQLPNNVVRVFFNELPHEYEAAVKADVMPGAVVTKTGGVGNGFGELPIGGNQGAFAAGFSTGPDAFRVTFDNATNTASVLFDQRVMGTNASSFVLLDANGTPLPGGVGQTAGPDAADTTTPGPYVITVSFTGASVANAKALEIQGPLTFETAAAEASLAPNVQQIVSPTGAAAVLRPHAKVRWVRVAVKHHQHQRHRTKHKKH